MAGNQQETVEAPQAGQGEQQVTRQLPSEQQQMELEPLQVDPNAMTEEEQMEYALRMSMAGAGFWLFLFVKQKHFNWIWIVNK